MIEVRLNDRVLASKSEEVALTRLLMVRIPWFRLSINRIHPAADDDVPHNHASGFWSLILRGGYDEELWFGLPRRPDRRWFRHLEAPDDVLRRRAPSLRFVREDEVHFVRSPLAGTLTIQLSFGPLTGTTEFDEASDDPPDASPDPSLRWVDGGRA